MKNSSIKIIEDGQRLHIVIEGDKTILDALKGLLSGVTGTSTEIIDDFEPVTTPQLSKEEEEKLLSEYYETKEDESETFYNIHKDGFLNQREKYYKNTFDSYKEMSSEEKDAYKKALSEWIQSYYESDPYIKDGEELKWHRNFLSLFRGMLKEELSSAEKTLGYQPGTFEKSASNEEVMLIFEECRKSLLDRSKK